MEKEIFCLSKKEIELSKTYYNGKVIKCLIAPYHSYSQLEYKFDCDVYLFPERNMSLNETKGFIFNIINDDTIQEAVIVTSSDYIIWDMIDPCVRILTIDEEIAMLPTKTLRANRLDLESFIFSNDEHDEFKVPDEVDSYSDKIIMGIIDDINKHIDGDIPMGKKEFDLMSGKIEMLGDTFLRISMQTHCEKIKIK